MHTLKFNSKPSRLNKIIYNMCGNSEWLVTNDQPGAHSDLGNCMVGTRPPYFVLKIHAFRTNEKRERVRIQQETDRMNYLKNIVRAAELAKDAQRAGISVKDLIERDGGTYDEEYDECRLVAKVPGLNVYIELLGCMEPEDTSTERWWSETSGQHTTDRAIDTEAAEQVNRAAVFYRATTIKSRQRDLATMPGDWQPREDWREEYDPDEFFPRPAKRGVGFGDTDPSRRPAQYVKHAFNDEERDEYLKLREEAERLAAKEGRSLSAHELARIQQMAAANIAARKMTE